MNSHVNELLAAYHDGELSANRRHQVESHLQDCSSCRAKLEMLQELSSLLQADIVPSQTPPQRFAAQVQLRIPRALSTHKNRNAGRPPRWVLGIPLALITVWAFLMAALKVTSFLFVADQVLGPNAAFFNDWITSEGLLTPGVNLILFNIVLLIGTGILWSAWMAFWLAWRKNQTESSIKGGVI